MTYPNYDQWGLTQIPTASGSVFKPIFSCWGKPILPPTLDPALAITLDWLGTWLDTDNIITRAWQAVSGDAGARVLKAVFIHDPADVVFNDRDIPALYMWRDSATDEWAADDWQRQTTKIIALWVFPIPTQEKQRIRQPFGHILAKSISAGIERGRTPSWQQPGDSDPDAATLGSLFWTFAGFENFALTSWRKTALQVPLSEHDGGMSRDEYPAIEFTFSMQEKLDYGLGRYATLNGANDTISNATLAPLSAWGASTFYGGASFVVPVPANGSYYLCTTPGQSGATAPNWPTSPGGTVTDGSAVWTCQGPVSVVTDSGPLSTT